MSKKLSSLNMFLSFLSTPFIMLKIMPWWWGYYHGEFTGNAVCQIEGGKAHSGTSLSSKITQIHKDWSADVWTQGITWEWEYMCWQNVSVDIQANNLWGATLAEFLACPLLFTTLLLSPRLTSDFSVSSTITTNKGEWNKEDEILRNLQGFILHCNQY